MSFPGDRVGVASAVSVSYGGGVGGAEAPGCQQDSLIDLFFTRAVQWSSRGQDCTRLWCATPGVLPSWAAAAAAAAVM